MNKAPHRHQFPKSLGSPSLLLLLTLVVTSGQTSAKAGGGGEPLTQAQRAEGQVEALGITNAKQPEADLLFGGQPTADQLRAAAESGFSVINLRMLDEDAGYPEPELAKELELDYRPIPVDRAALEDPATYEQFYRALEEADRPTLVHCASGNRVGALYYAYLVEQKGMAQDQALARAKENGLRSNVLAEAVSRYLESRP